SVCPNATHWKKKPPHWRCLLPQKTSSVPVLWQECHKEPSIGGSARNVLREKCHKCHKKKLQCHECHKPSRFQMIPNLRKRCAKKPHPLTALSTTCSKFC